MGQTAQKINNDKTKGRIVLWKGDIPVLISFQSFSVFISKGLFEILCYVTWRYVLHKNHMNKMNLKNN